MWSQRQSLLSLLVILLVTTVLFGCRAFVPEVVIVNKPPETYIIGAPAETTGGYYHYHVYWYGSDADGEVQKFVWALTDTSIQNLETDEDEEDTRFNPALNISTLQIGHWTTKTDSIFDFSLDQGPVLAYDMTLHMVAVDDRGDYDRSPARLHFISNALGNPRLAYTKQNAAGEITPFANNDTIAYGEKFRIGWAGSTPNVRSYSPELLAQRDTVPPIDGLLGYKFRLLEVDCDDSREDCWNPRIYDDALGDSLSFFGTVRGLAFENDESGPDVYHKRLEAGVHRLLVNTIDVAGVEVPSAKQELNVVVNYDPDTRLLHGETDPFYGDDTHVYPYFRVFRDNQVIDEYTFVEGDTVPDRAYAVFKALGRDDPRDLKLDPDYLVTFQGLFEAVGLFNDVYPFHFESGAGGLGRTEAWQPTEPNGWSADTLGLLVGPADFTVKMRSVDEHGKRDLTPDSLSFHGNYPPCVQCVEVLNNNGTTSITVDDDCWNLECASRVDTMVASQNPNPNYTLADQAGIGQFYYKLSTREVWTQRPLQLADVDSVPGIYYSYRLLLHGKDHPLEPALRPADRVMSWRYAIISENDPENNVRDGGGLDGLRTPTYHYSTSPDSLVYLDDDGVWILKVKFFVPFILQSSGPTAWYNDRYNFYLDSQKADLAFFLTTIQLGSTTATVIARDASICDVRPDNGVYYYFPGARPPTVLSGGRHPYRVCNPQGFPSDLQPAGSLVLDSFAFESEPFTKHYEIKVLISSTQELYP